MGKDFPAPDTGRVGRCIQHGFVDVNLPLKLSQGLSSSGPFMWCQDGNLALSRMSWCQGD